MKRKIVKLTPKMIETISHALDICQADYDHERDGGSAYGELKNEPYQKKMIREIDVVRRALWGAK